MDLPTPLESQSNMKKITKINLKDTIISLLIAVAYGLFAYFSLHTFFDYQKELTGFNQEVVTTRELPMPVITVCSQNIFKNVSKETNTETVVENLNDHVYARGDLFDEEMFSSKNWNWSKNYEIFSRTLGLCYTLRTTTNSTIDNDFYISLHENQRYQVGFFNVNVLGAISILRKGVLNLF